MTWEWSHSPEAYAAVAENISRQSREWLEVVWAEWVANESKYPYVFSDLNLRTYATALARSKAKSDSYLVEFIQLKTEKQRLCENGGWNAYCCPFGCNAHKLPFDILGE